MERFYAQRHFPHPRCSESSQPVDVPSFSTASHTCDYCAAALISTSSVDPERINRWVSLHSDPLKTRQRGSLRWRNVLPHSMHQVSAANAEGCPFFVWIWGQIMRSRTLPEQLMRTRICLVIESVNGVITDAIKCSVLVSTDKYSWSPTGGTFDIESDAYDPCANDAVGRTIDGGTFSERGISQIRRRLQVCLESHQSCRQGAGIRPLRFLVISAEENETVRIRQIHGAKTDPYVALSYCWGLEQTAKTTTVNLARHERGIEVRGLPKTIQDAIYVTRRLGIRLLWVDSLCMVQNDPVLLAKEVGDMAHYYANSMITISAAVAKSCAEGFLNPPDPTESDGYVGFYFPFDDKPRLDSSPNRRLKLFRAEARDEIDHIDTRAWTLQESLLATRLVSFGTRRISWACMTTRFGPSSGATSLRDNMFKTRHWVGYGDRIAHNTSYGNHPRDPEHLISDLHGILYPPPEAIFQLWSKVVEEFSQRTLSIPGDRLLAISGVAQTLGNMVNPSSDVDASPYAAGLWNTPLLPLELLWMPKNPFTPQLSSSYIAPSWSWASFPGAVVWHLPDLTHLESCIYPRSGLEKKVPSLVYRDNSVDYEKLAIRSRTNGIGLSPLPQVVALSVEPLIDVAPYGAVTSGYVTLRGKCFNRMHDVLTPWHIQMRFDSGEELDSLRELPPGFICFHILGYVVEDGIPPEHYDRILGTNSQGLILERAQDGTYRRVGLYVGLNIGDRLRMIKTMTEVTIH
ncbi:heterokaryon incompatibility protein-domain-containing protein [Colletotrichum phormii]|uniref:Heterokaryon incompatibility protein-domain-containing protein n=1 Tax=Colletotrichum phormii TaxID=359342 RepID=A0AAI9ZIP8_9PEZI|nr:heterokaryon incompatibility protein-domain-containing protein [Colletotrichum phormii]KAK1625324.1 heterokaryon incompatibility protein-domain-containing protein [Colletotrichum phormii]